MLDDEATARLAAFFSIRIVMMLRELAAPRRRIAKPRLLRWSDNRAIVASTPRCRGSAFRPLN